MFDLNDKNSIINTFLGENTSNDDYLDEGMGLYEEDPENDIALSEAMFMSYLNADEIDELCENSAELNYLIDKDLLSEKVIVKFDKKAKLNRAEKLAVLTIAKEKKDRDFYKLVRVWKMRRLLLEKLNKKYGSQAKTRAKQMIKKQSSSRSTTGKKVAKRAAKK